nr:hypothetical protein CFP56_68813 [Quercus suber]
MRSADAAVSHPYTNVYSKNCFSLKTAAIEAGKLISEALVYVLKRNEGLSFIEEFLKLLSALKIILIALIGLLFQGLAASPLHTHSNIILPFIAATIVYQIAYMVIKLQAQGAGPIWRFYGCSYYDVDEEPTCKYFR